MSVILLLTFIVVILSYCIHRWFTKWKFIEIYPGPIPLPIIGNAHQLGFNPRDYLENLMKWWYENKCGTFRIWIGSHPYIFFTDPKDIEALLSNNVIIEKGDIYELFDSWLGKGLLTSTGQKWFKHRKMITPSFHFKILTDFLETMNKNSNKFVEKLSIKSQTEEIFDFQDMTHYCTLDTICETAMGTEINAMDNHDSILVKAFQDMCEVIQNRAFSSWKRNAFLYQFSKEYQIEIEALKILKAFTMDVIKNRSDLLKNSTNNDDDDEHKIDNVGIKTRKAFLDNLLTAQIDGKPLTLHEVCEEVQTFMFEGHDTTTSGVSFCTYLISRHPEVQEKLFEEQKILFNSNFESVPSYQDLLEMKYLELVIKESQRLYPSVPIFARCTRSSITLNDKYIPANTTVTALAIAMGYNEKYFKEPNKFDPERFRNREGSNPFDYIPFSAGPRNCIGQKFAMQEMKSIISNIIRNFIILPPTDNCIKNDNNDGKVCTDYDPILAAVLTLKSVNGIQIRLRNRI